MKISRRHLANGNHRGLTRRRFLSAGAAATLLRPADLYLASAAPVAAIDVVRSFGFVPDGKTDNYAAFHRWAAYVTSVGGGNYVFPPGTYYVAQYRTTYYASGDTREVSNPHLFRCNGLQITGYGARIRLNGRFHRPARIGSDKVQVGRHYAAVMPFTLRQCRNVSIRGFDIDGGVRDMSRDPGVREAHAHLIGIQACSDVLLEDLSLHHSQTDGVHLSDDWIFSHMRPAHACRNIRMNRVHCRNNARGGLAAIQVFGLTCTNCLFNGNGFDVGGHGAHPPGFGVDIEPDRANEGIDIDTKTGNIQFIRCEMSDNISAFVAAYAWRFKGDLQLVQCQSRNSHGRRNHMIICWPGALIDGGRHDSGKGNIWTSWKGQSGGNLTMRECVVLSSGNFGIFHAHDGNRLTLDRVKVTGTHTEHEYGAFPAVQANPGAGQKNHVSGCEIFIPAARKSPARNWDLEPSFNHTVCSDNLFLTDLPATAQQHFATRYGAGTTVKADRYRGTNPGPTDSFRPSPDSRHDTTQPFSSHGG